MSSPVSPTPTAFGLVAVQVDNPVGASSLGRLAEECSFHGGYNVHVVGSTNTWEPPAPRQQLNTLEVYQIPFTYYRSPGAQVLAIAVVLCPVGGPTSAPNITLTVTLPNGARWLVANGLDGSRTFPYPPPNRVAQTEIVGYVDVSDVAPARPTFVLVRTGVAGQAVSNRRMLSVSLTEVPLAQSNVSQDPTEPHLEQAWTLHPNQIIDGGATSPRGLQRLAHLMDTYRTQFVRHVQIAGTESDYDIAAATTPHWYRAQTVAGFGDIEWLYNGGTHNVTRQFALRDLYGGLSGTQDWDVWVRYRTRSATVAATLRILVEGVGGAAAVAQDLVLPASLNRWSWASRRISVPTDGAGGLCNLTLALDTGSTVDTDIVHISNVCLAEAPYPTELDPTTLSPTLILDADSLSAGAVSSWPNAGSAGGNFVSVVGLGQPECVAAVANSHNVVRFVNTDLDILQGGSTPTYVSLSEFSVFAVVRPATGLSPGGSGDGTAYSNPAVWADTAGRLVMATNLGSPSGTGDPRYQAYADASGDRGTSVMCAPLLDQWAVVEVRLSGGTMRITSNGRPEGTVSPVSAINISTGNLAVGCRFVGGTTSGNHFHGDIAYLVAWNTDIGNQPAAQVRAWLGSRFGIKVA